MNQHANEQVKSFEINFDDEISALILLLFYLRPEMVS